MKRIASMAVLLTLSILVLAGCSYSPGVESTQSRIREHMETNMVEGRQTTAVTLLSIDQTDHSRQISRAMIQQLRVQKSHTRNMPVLNADDLDQAVAYISDHQNTGDALMFASTAGLMQLGTGTQTWYEYVKPLGCVGVEHNYIVVRTESPWHDLTHLISSMRNGEPVRWGWNAQRGAYDASWTHAFLDACGCGVLPNITLQEIGEDIALSILSDRTDVLCVSAYNVLPLLQTGELRALASMAPARFDVPILRDVPTLKEYGLSITDGNAYFIFCPKEYPAIHEQYWLSQLHRLLQNTAWQQTCSDMCIMLPQ